jgi:hypothetical protein
LKASPNNHGYPAFTAWCFGKKRTFLLHQVICEAFHGVKPFPGAQARHLDGNPLNDRADNIKWGSAKENIADKRVHGRVSEGERNGQAKLTAPQVLAIRERRAAGVSQVGLAREYGVTERVIWLIVTRRAWQHI